MLQRATFVQSAEWKHISAISDQVFKDFIATYLAKQKEVIHAVALEHQAEVRKALQDYKVIHPGYEPYVRSALLPNVPEERETSQRSIGFGVKMGNGGGDGDSNHSDGQCNHVEIPEEMLWQANLAVGDPVEWTLTAAGDLALRSPYDAGTIEAADEADYQEWKLREVAAGFC